MKIWGVSMPLSASRDIGASGGNAEELPAGLNNISLELINHCSPRSLHPLIPFVFATPCKSAKEAIQ